MMLPLLNDTADSSEVLRRLSRQLQRGHPAHKDIQLLLTVLDDPLLRTVLQIKNSLDDLKVLVHKHPSILPRDFDIARDGTLDYRCDSEDTNQNGQQSNHPLAPTNGSSTGIIAGPSTANRLSGSRQQQLHYQQSDQHYHGAQADVLHGQQRSGPFGASHSSLQRFSGAMLDDVPSGERFVAVELLAAPAASDGQQSGGLGLTVVPVVGDDGETHFYIKHIHTDGVAHRDGRLNEGDKVVAINGIHLSGLSHRDVVQLLQQYNSNITTSSTSEHSGQQSAAGGASDLLDTTAAGKPAANLVSLLVDTSQQLFAHQRQARQLHHLQGLQQQLASLSGGDLDNCWTSEGVAVGAAGQQPSQSDEFNPEMVLNSEWAQVEAIELVNDGSGLGFGIIGGRSTGVVVKTILPGGVADRDGRLLSGDHILQIGDVNLRGMGSEQVAAVLRQAGTSVRLVVARPVDASVAAGVEGLTAPVVPTRILADADQIERHLAMFSNNNNNSVDENTGITTAGGVVFSSGAAISGSTVVSSGPSSNVFSSKPLEAAVADQTSVTPARTGSSSGGSVGATGGASTTALPLASHSPSSSSQSGKKLNQEAENVVVGHEMHAELFGLMGLNQLQLPEMETFEVELVKDQQGLGITIAGYVCEKGKDEEISGVFVKSIAKGSAADIDGRIRVNDQVIEVDSRPLRGYTNHQAVELLRSTGKVVKLRLARYLRGARYDQLQQAIMAESVQHGGSQAQLISACAQPLQPQLASVSPPPGGLSSANAQHATSSICTSPFVSASSASTMISSCTTLSAMTSTTQTATNATANILTSSSNYSNNNINNNSISSNNARNNNCGTPGGGNGSFTPNSSVALANLDNLIHGSHQLPSGLSYMGAYGQESEQEKIAKWTAVFGADEYDIVVAQLCKFHEGGGLGISLEGTVDVNEAGEEVRPHHYIRSVLPDGPVGLNGVLRSGDELIEVNGRQLLGLDHRDVVTTLKDLPLNVEMVCARPKNSLAASVGSCSPTAATPRSAASQAAAPRHHQASKAKSDTSLNRYSSEDEESGGGCSMGYASGGYLGAVGGTGGPSCNKLNKLRSRSLEPLSGLAMWSNEPQLIELHKAERGLGFSILDYQDPMNPNETVIVIRSLVPGGVAQQDGRLIPGDRLLFVNDVNLENASLDAAVQTLKGAPRGPVRIGVAKPLPLPCPHDGAGGLGSSGAAGHLTIGETGTLAALVKSESF